MRNLAGRISSASQYSSEALLMSGSKYYFALNDLVAAGQTKLLRILVPLIEDFELFRRRLGDVFHPAHPLRHASAARAIEAARFHLHSRRFAGFDEILAIRNFG